MKEVTVILEGRNGEFVEKVVSLFPSRILIGDIIDIDHLREDDPDMDFDSPDAMEYEQWPEFLTDGKVVACIWGGVDPENKLSPREFHQIITVRPYHETDDVN
jgi:hypothetical protein